MEPPERPSAGQRGPSRLPSAALALLGPSCSPLASTRQQPGPSRLPLGRPLSICFPGAEDTDPAAATSPFAPLAAACVSPSPAGPAPLTAPGPTLPVQGSTASHASIQSLLPLLSATLGSLDGAAGAARAAAALGLPAAPAPAPLCMLLPEDEAAIAAAAAALAPGSPPLGGGDLAGEGLCATDPLAHLALIGSDTLTAGGAGLGQALLGGEAEAEQQGLVLCWEDEALLLAALSAPAGVHQGGQVQLHPTLPPAASHLSPSPFDQPSSGPSAAETQPQLQPEAAAPAAGGWAPAAAGGGGAGGAPAPLQPDPLGLDPGSLQLSLEAFDPGLLAELAAEGSSALSPMAAGAGTAGAEGGLLGGAPLGLEEAASLAAGGSASGCCLMELEDCLDDAFSDAPPCTGLGLCLREPTAATPPPAKRPRMMSEGAPLGDPLNSTKGIASPLMLPARAGADGGSVAGASAAAAASAPLPSISNCEASMAGSGAAAGAGEEQTGNAAPAKGATRRSGQNGGTAAGMERRGPVTRGRQAERSKQAERSVVVGENGQAEASRPAEGEASGTDAPARRSTQSEKASPSAYKEFRLPPTGGGNRWRPTRCRFLFQKTLTRSDTTSLGRVVLPRLEVERHLPACPDRAGLELSVLDSNGVPHAFQLKYWLNRSTGADSPSKRMYILEGTAGFAAAQRLRAGSRLAFYAAPGGRLVVHSTDP